MAQNRPGETALIYRFADSGDAGPAAQIAAGLSRDVAAANPQPLVLAAEDDAGSLAGGLTGIIHWRWLYIRQFWVAPARRGQGIGRRLLEQAEARALFLDCVGVYLDTFDEGAAQFYEKCGFEVCGAIGNFPPGGRRIFLSKPLGFTRQG